MVEVKNKIEDSVPVCYFPLIVDMDRVESYNSPLHKPPFEFAMDLASKEGEQILSPVYGKVIDLKQYSTQWTPYVRGKVVDPNLTLNWITIQIYRKVGIFSKEYKKTPWIVQMCHIQAFSCNKIVGEFVNEMDELAKVGLNGIITVDENGKPDSHLHVVIGKGKSVDNPFEAFQSYPLNFRKK